MFKALRALKAAEGVAETDRAAMIQVCGGV
jgi:hypothetical protein